MSFSRERFDALPIVGILRGFPPHQSARLLDAARSGGLKNVEITMDSPSAAEQIRRAIDAHGTEMNIGAGTVTSVDLLERALDSGARFIVTPSIHPGVMARCRDLGVPVFPGAMTPTEIVLAWELGAMLVKLFPAETLGPGYVKALKAPLPHIKLMPTGGVDLKTLPDFMRAGADGFGVGSPLFDKAQAASGDWPEIESKCRAFAEAYRLHLGAAE
jgi:2-dehydro-3-deoxyphosphogluconate aldolase/(4S)-4-hydroxy-2-oxoglutarate aldolase